ncbi:ATP-dependent clpX-like chaperone, mitochondrial [Lachnellula occidentalis]|uniref:ATP-dependent clpX-like chaperone, mitochondrial n=1 Tax=Lachnellula occidentalis TaxID=215460 RepID=A0A8H8S3F7_9HELO|nr:ATP-dependent clpX-like chaperone, mitochondrial [Lachnellula occidentalis]
MPVIYRTFPLNPSPRTVLILNPIRRHFSTIPRLLDSQFRRSDFQSHSWTGSYEPGRPTEGPLSEASRVGASKLTPSLLKEHLDKFVVGQDKAKKVTSVAIFNHYQRIRELRRQQAEEEERYAREERQRKARRDRERKETSHPVEDEYPGHVQTVDLNAIRRVEPELGSHILYDNSATTIEKSNLLLLGPSGVGKTYILQTLARVLEVPFATVDCSSLTQAGYIGTDIESSIERLLLASSHSVSKCETGIIFFDELDKLAKPAVMTHGRDVSGEGVQQGLLKMIEGTTVTVKTSADKSSKPESKEGGEKTPPAAAKGEQYTIDTSNILFVFAGAFVGLESIISKRLSSGTSIGFGAQLKAPLVPSQKPSTGHTNNKKSPKSNLHKVTPTDLQSYGLIPELLGRIPLTVSLSPLSLTHLISILSEPKNSLIKQYTALFNTYGISLRFTTGALHAVAERALGRVEEGGGIGARGLRGILEGVLQEIMFWGPGSGIRFCLIDESFVRSSSSPSGKEAKVDGVDEDEEEEEAKMPRCWSRGQNRLFDEAYEVEEGAWFGRLGEGDDRAAGSFERLRSVGSSGM